MHIAPVVPKSITQKKKKPRKPGRHRLREKLIGMITTGQISPGEKLTQTRLGKKFGVSMSVMREALLDLQTYGLVESHDNRGFFVRSFDAKTILDLYDLREVLEGLAAREACQRIKSSDVVELNDIIDKMCAAEEAGNYEQRAEYDRLFHDRITQISNNQAVLNLTRQCSLFHKVVYTPTNVEHIRNQHTTFLDAIASHQQDLSERIAREHVLDGKRQVENLLNQGNGGIYWLVDGSGNNDRNEPK